MPKGTWIYEINTATGGGTPPPYVPSDAPPVTITDADGNTPGVGYATDTYDGNVEIKVYWKAAATATDENFRGVAIYLEDPDISSASELPMDGSTAMDGTAHVSGTWTPKKINDSFESPATFLVPAKAFGRTIRVYAQAFGKVTNATLVRANESNPTPSVLIYLPAEVGGYVSGEEYAWLIANPSVTQIDDWDAPGGPVYHLVFDYTEPPIGQDGNTDPSIPLPPGLREFGGVRIWYEYDDGSRAMGPYLESQKPDTWVSENYVPGDGGTFRCYFVSVDVDGRANTIVPDLTPSIDVTVVYPPAGQASAPYITAFQIDGAASSPGRQEWQPDFTVLAKADLTWTNPSSPRYGGVYFYRTGITPPRQLGIATGNVASLTVSVVDWPKAVEDWTIVAISVDYNGKPSDDPAHPAASTPRVHWLIGPPGPGGSGQEYTGVINVSGVTVTTEQQLNSDGVVMMRHKISGWSVPPDNSFGGVTIARLFPTTDTSSATYWDVPKNVTSFTTDWEPAPTARTWDFYFLSRDGQDRRNSLQIGLSPHVPHSFTPMVGDILASRLPTDWFNTAEFDWPNANDGGLFTAKLFIARKVYVGNILRVGGGSGGDGSANVGYALQGLENGQVGVFNAGNQLVAWMGQQDGKDPNNNTHRIYGGWFAELYVGGSGPPTAPLYADNTGRVIIGGFQASNGNAYPYLTIRDSTNTEVGRVGAQIGLTSAPAPQVYMHGAWFRDLAVGGQTITDWRLLSYQDPTLGNTMQLRNIYRFTIDYPANYPTPANPNGAVHMEFGAATFLANSDTSFWKFPGFGITKTGTKQGAALVDRGLILSDANGHQMGAFVIFNGDQKGSDTGGFGGYLTLGNPFSFLTSVTLSGGDYANGQVGAYFILRNHQNTQTFAVDMYGNVTAAGNVSLNGSLIQSGVTIIDTSGKFFPRNGLDTSGGINAALGYLVAGVLVINQQQQFVGSGINIGNNGVAAGAFNPNISGEGQWYGQSGQFVTQDGKTVTFRGGVIVRVQ